MLQSSHRQRADAFSLAEVLIALAIVSFSFASLFAILSQGLQLVRSQQETIAATLCVQERIEQIRAGNWLTLTNAVRLKDKILSTAVPSSASLIGLEEEITVSLYPAVTPLKTPIRLRRSADGAVQVVTDPGDNSLLTSLIVRVDVRASWNTQARSRSRTLSTVVSMGGILR